MSSLEDKIFNPDSKHHWWHHLYPWSWKRVKNLIPAALSHFPGVKKHVLYTTAIKDHPTYKYVSRGRFSYEARAAGEQYEGRYVLTDSQGDFYCVSFDTEADAKTAVKVLNIASTKKTSKKLNFEY